MKSTGFGEPSKLQAWLDDMRFKLRHRLGRQIDINDGTHQYKFCCNTTIEAWRAMTLLVKEEGTVRLFTDEAKPGDVVYDIGANVGPYTVIAANYVRPSGVVYAFEPHASNFRSLLENVSANRLGDVVRVLSCALNDKEGFFDFNYYMATAGSSMSQLGDSRDDHDKAFRPVFTECKYATTIDKLVRDGVIKPANLIKIDVDGNELLILEGMRTLIKNTPPRAILIEMNARYKNEVYEYMRSYGFQEIDRQYGMLGKLDIAKGADPNKIGYNGLFRQAAPERR